MKESQGSLHLYSAPELVAIIAETVMMYDDKNLKSVSQTRAETSGIEEQVKKDAQHFAALACACYISSQQFQKSDKISLMQERRCGHTDIYPCPASFDSLDLWARHPIAWPNISADGLTADVLHFSGSYSVGSRQRASALRFQDSDVALSGAIHRQHALQ